MGEIENIDGIYYNSYDVMVRKKIYTYFLMGLYISLFIAIFIIIFLSENTVMEMKLLLALFFDIVIFSLLMYFHFKTYPYRVTLTDKGLKIHYQWLWRLPKSQYVKTNRDRKYIFIAWKHIKNIKINNKLFKPKCIIRLINNIRVYELTPVDWEILIEIEKYFNALNTQIDVPSEVESKNRNI